MIYQLTIIHLILTHLLNYVRLWADMAINITQSEDDLIRTSQVFLTGHQFVVHRCIISLFEEL